MKIDKITEQAVRDRFRMALNHGVLFIAWDPQETTSFRALTCHTRVWREIKGDDELAEEVLIGVYDMASNAPVLEYAFEDIEAYCEV